MGPHKKDGGKKKENIHWVYEPIGGQFQKTTTQISEVNCKSPSEHFPNPPLVLSSFFFFLLFNIHFILYFILSYFIFCYWSRLLLSRRTCWFHVRFLEENPLSPSGDQGLHCVSLLFPSSDDPLKMLQLYIFLFLLPLPPSLSLSLSLSLSPSLSLSLPP